MVTTTVAPGAASVPEIGGYAVNGPPVNTSSFGSFETLRLCVVIAVRPAESTTWASMVQLPSRSLWVKFHVLSDWLGAVRTNLTAGSAWEKWMLTV